MAKDYGLFSSLMGLRLGYYFGKNLISEETDEELIGRLLGSYVAISIFFSMICYVFLT